MKEGLTKAQETLRQRLRDRLTGRKGLLAELKRLAIVDGASGIQPYSFGLQYVIYHNAVNIHSNSINFIESKSQDRATWIKMVSDVAKIVKRHSEEFINDTANEIEDLAKVLVPQEILERVLCVQELADRWAWPSSFSIAHGALSVLVASNQWLSDTRLFYEWPPGVTSAELWTWAGSKIEKISPESANSLNLTLKKRDETLADGNWPLGIPWGFPWGTNPIKSIPLTVLAWLYYAEQTARSVLPAAPKGYLLDIQKPTVRTMKIMNGSHPVSWENDEGVARSIYADDKTIERIVCRWHDGGQLELFADTEENDNIFLELARKHGPAAVRTFHFVYFLYYAQRARAGESVWFWPEECLEICGLQPSKENKAEIQAFIQNMSRSNAEWHFRHGKPLKAPLLACTATDTVALQLKLHPGMYRGVQHEDGTLGTYFWLMPQELLSASVKRNADRVHTLAAIAGGMFRASLNKYGDVRPAKIGASKLAPDLGIRGRRNRDTDERSAKTLRTTLNSGVEVNFFSQWEIEHGRLEDLSAVLVLHPSAEAIELVSGRRRIERPAFVPSTGLELADWLKKAGLNATEAGEQIGVPGSTMRRVTATWGARPLPYNVRRALRDHLWPGTKT